MMRVLFALAFGISAFLGVQAIADPQATVAGCGGPGGCDSVLGSRWAYVFGKLPVSLAGAGLYLAALVASFLKKDLILRICSWSAILAALWFAGLQVFAVKSFCFYCCGIHLCGSLAAIMALTRRPKPTPAVNTLSAIIATGSVAALAIFQSFGPQPETHSMIEAELGAVEKTPEEVTPTENQEAPPTASFLDGHLQYKIEDHPHLGNSSSPYVLMELFDYTCTSCRELSADIEALQKKHPGQFCIIALPTPLNRKCNSKLNPKVKDHKDACEYAYLALAVFHADPGKFETFHHWLMKGGKVPPPLSDTESKAAALLGGVDQLKAAMSSPKVKASLTHNTERLSQLSQKNSRMPKVLMKSKSYIQGIPRTRERFIAIVEEQMGLSTK